MGGCSCNHEWKEATCTEPKICEKCDKTEGEALGHIEGAMEISKIDNVKAKTFYKAKCSRCNEVLDSKEEDIKSFINESLFNLTPIEFSERIDDQLYGMADNVLVAKTTENDHGDFVVAIGDSSTNKAVAGFMFIKNGESNFSYENRNESGFEGVFCRIYDNDSLARVLLSTVLAFDPSLSFSEGKDVTSSILSELSYTKNKVTYILAKIEGAYVIGVSV